MKFYSTSLVLSFLLSCCVAIYAQKPIVPPTGIRLLPTDSVFVLVEGDQRYLQHTVKMGQTLYSIAKFYAVEISDLNFCNPILAEKGIRVGQVLKVPISGRALRRSKGAGFVDSLFVKVYYRVKPSETMYRLSNIYFKMPIDVIQKMNKISPDAGLRNGQVLHIAWLQKYGIPDSLRRYNGLTGILLEKNTENLKKYEEAKLTKKEGYLEGAACWLKGERYSDNTNLSVLFNGLPVGAIVRLENPMTGRIVYAKVIGAVPENAYVDGAIVVISPTVAFALGALDARFFIKLNYLK